MESGDIFYLDGIRSFNLSNPFNKLKSFCKPKWTFETLNWVKLFCEERKVIKGSMKRFGYLRPWDEKLPSSLLEMENNVVTLELPIKSAGKETLLRR